MIKLSVLVALTGFTAVAGPNCVAFYNNQSKTIEKIAREQTRQAKRDARVMKNIDPKLVKELYEPMFVKQFESEFGVTLNESYRELFRKLLFEPDSLKTEADWEMLRSGFPHDTKIDQEVPNNSLLKSYLNLNHLTIERQENEAEAILSKIRGKNIQLKQIEIVALRVARVIGRDYDFFAGTNMEISQEQVYRMKNRFLSLFSFGEKNLTDAEQRALFDAHITTDNPVSTYRYAINQVYDFKYKNANGKEGLYITNEMIDKRNQKVLESAEKYKNPTLTAEINKKLENPKLKASLDRLNTAIENDAGLAESLRFVRLTISGQTGKQNPFKDSNELGQFVEKQTQFFVEALKKLKEPEAKWKVKLLMEGMSEDTLHKDHVASLKVRLDMSKPESRKMIEFMESELGIRLFGVIRTEYRRMEPGFFGTKKLDIGDLEEIFKRNLGLLEETTDLKRKQPDLFEAVYQFKLVRTGLTKPEAIEIFKIGQRNPVMRLLSLIIFDPLAKYGFCFGRAYWFQKILEAHGIHPDSIGKVLVDGRMKGGISGWGWHIAPTAEREGGGLWVFDQSHGEVQTITKWFSHYHDHMENGELVQGASQDFKQMENQYESFWNKFGFDNKYFRDVGRNLEANNYNDEAKHAFKKFRDNIFDALKIGY